MYNYNTKFISKFEIALKEIIKMKEQVGENRFNKDGIIQKGIIIRHLILQNYINVAMLQN